MYDELRKLAALKLASESSGQTLQAIALVHEVWLRLGGDHQPTWQNHVHFLNAAAEVMRRFLIDNARHKLPVRHGGALELVPWDNLEVPAATESHEQLLAVNDALDRLALEDKPKAELVKLRYFAGLTIEEAAQALSVSKPTAKRWWAYARGWLFREINGA